MISKTLKSILDRIETWPEDRQEAAVRMLLELEDPGSSALGLSPEQVAEVHRRRDNPNRSFVTMDEVRELLTRQV